jgi:radical SAM protein with 4Fe4S-binding SPASM domain
MDINPPVLVSFSVTRQCNLRCRQCYSVSVETPHPDELTTGEAHKLISEIARSGARLLIFDGGEPLMRPDLPELISYTREIGLRPLLGTNASLIDDAMAQKLKSAGLAAAAISLDAADAQTHDDIRGQAGSFDGAIAGMQALRRAGIPFQIGPCINSRTLGELPKIAEWGKKLGAIAMEVFDYIPSGRAKESTDLELTSEQKHQLVRQIIDLQRGSDEILFRCIGIPQYWVEVEKTVPEDEVMSKFVRTCCGAGVRYACVLYDGTVFPCMVLQKAVGNVRETPFDVLWQESEVFATLRNRDNLEGKCGACAYRTVCGGARCRVYETTGSLTAEDSACWFKPEELTGR